MDIVVVGSGPAGSAVAVGLRKLGYRVQVLATRRGFSSIEGISERTLQALRDLGLNRAASSVGGAVQRITSWDESSRQTNSEFLLDRERFDAALREDLASYDIELIDVRVAELDLRSGVSRLHSDEGQLFEAGFVVDARGRAAHQRGNAAIKGPATLSLSR